METQHKEVAVEKRTTSTFNKTDLVVRFSALALTLVAAVLLGVDRQTKSMMLSPLMPPVNLVAKWTHLSAFVYFVTANAIACAYAAISLAIILVTRGGHKLVSMMVMILDLVMVALLFSAIGAAGSIALIGYQGNSHVQWNKVCNVFDKFCHQGAVAIFLSLAGCIAYLMLVLLTVLRLHKKF